MVNVGRLGSKNDLEFASRRVLSSLAARWLVNEMQSKRRNSKKRRTMSGALSASEKWDHSIENGLRKTSLGAVLGLLPAVMLARTAVMRCGVVFAAAGFGAGMAYGEARYLFDHDVSFDRRHVVSVKLVSSTSS
jgi:hypothetical protein